MEDGSQSDNVSNSESSCIHELQRLALNELSVLSRQKLLADVELSIKMQEDEQNITNAWLILSTNDIQPESVKGSFSNLVSNQLCFSTDGEVGKRTLYRLNASKRSSNGYMESLNGLQRAELLAKALKEDNVMNLREGVEARDGMRGRVREASELIRKVNSFMELMNQRKLQDEANLASMS
jgi:hypothetical protein